MPSGFRPNVLSPREPLKITPILMIFEWPLIAPNKYNDQYLIFAMLIEINANEPQ